jgi:hypothetical protein
VSGPRPLAAFPLAKGLRPHSSWPGYVCERVSRDPAFPGQVAVFRRHEVAPFWPETIPGINAWIVARIHGSQVKSFSTEPSEDKARRTMKRLCRPPTPL